MKKQFKYSIYTYRIRSPQSYVKVKALTESRAREEAMLVAWGQPIHPLFPGVGFGLSLLNTEEYESVNNNNNAAQEKAT